MRIWSYLIQEFNANKLQIIISVQKIGQLQFHVTCFSIPGSIFPLFL
jgi:hypothetical protein